MVMPSKYGFDTTEDDARKQRERQREEEDRKQALMSKCLHLAEEIDSIVQGIGTDYVTARGCRPVLGKVLELYPSPFDKYDNELRPLWMFMVEDKEEPKGVWKLMIHMIAGWNGEVYLHVSLRDEQN